MVEEIEVIHSRSAPGSISTSLMYSFGQVDFDGFCLDSVLRDDMEVLDEPLYATFLRATGVDRPYKEELLSKMESDGHKVVKDIIYGPGEKKYRFCKRSNFSFGVHSPFIIVCSICNHLASLFDPSVKELGLTDLLAVYSELCELGKTPVIIDAADLRQDPEATLRSLCEDLDIPFQAAMLRWEAGPKPIDGFWAPWWYESAHKSTGFKPPRKYPELLLSSFFIFSHFNYLFIELLEQSLPFYNMLRRHVRKSSSLLKTPLPEPDLPVPANKKLLAWVGDEILPRNDAKVSVFDSIVQGGDGVWEGLRVYNGKIFKLEEHLDRMFDSAKALAFNNIPTREEIKEAIFKTLIRNGMFDNAHIRLTLTHGKKVTSGMGPGFNLYGCTLIVLPEWKPPVYDNTHGVTLVTATTRRNSPCNLDSKIHHNNLLNNILAKFMVKKGRVLTPHADYCLPGITRATQEWMVYKVWTSGTMGELSPVVKIDGRKVGDGKVGPVTQRLQNAFKQLTEGKSQECLYHPTMRLEQWISIKYNTMELQLLPPSE
ncbi:hypothetical protein Pint_19977 [Pistacia integerrima]|uniref:Uncharacterized protein n=1 Tax=Pistacia integerrima TaxID=434235 RepID=A0ACC0XCR4_9ROSI|nr:hypothetical protein Pint_19977 [Pistacia integerrima]